MLGQMCARLGAVFDLSGMRDADLSQRLGYSNATTLSAMRRGDVFPDVERLATLGRMVLPGGACPNLHWILTGAGAPFLPPRKGKHDPAGAVDAMNTLVLSRFHDQT